MMRPRAARLLLVTLEAARVHAELAMLTALRSRLSRPNSVVLKTPK
jgi:hypothetical protein